MRIGTLSRQLGIDVQTLRYYERIGLLPPPRRLPNRYRDYGDSHVECLDLIKGAQEMGFSLDEIRTIQRLVQARGGDCTRLHALLDGKSGEVRRQLGRIQTMAAALKKALARCEGAPKRGVGAFFEHVEAIDRRERELGFTGPVGRLRTAK